MKKFEVKKMGIGSLFKVTLYMMLLPSVIFFLIGIVVSLIGIVMQQTEMIFIGVICGVLYPIIFLGLYGVMSMLMGVIYNLFAQRFGGLELTLEEKDIYVPEAPKLVESIPVESQEPMNTQEIQPEDFDNSNEKTETEL